MPEAMQWGPPPGFKWIIDLKPGDAFRGEGGSGRGVVERHCPHGCGTVVTLAETSRSIGKTYDGKLIDITRHGRKIQISSHTHVVLITDEEERDGIMATTKKGSAKTRTTIASVIKLGLGKKWSNDRILSEVKKKFPDARTSKNSIDYYRSKLRTAKKAKSSEKS